MTSTSYTVRKFRRDESAARNASVCGQFNATATDGAKCHATIKVAMRSQGYRSNYEAVLKFWAFLTRNGEPYMSQSLTLSSLKHFISTLELEPEWHGWFDCAGIKVQS